MKVRGRGCFRSTAVASRDESIRRSSNLPPLPDGRDRTPDRVPPALLFLKIKPKLSISSTKGTECGII
jgi:hypothetical protein